MLPGIAGSAAFEAYTVTLPTESTLMSYPVYGDTAKVESGSVGMTATYAGARHDKLIDPETVDVTIFLLEVSAGRASHPDAEGNIPLLSARRCPTALRIVLIPDCLWVFRA